MTNVIKKYSISFELAQKMVNEAVAKATELGLTENVAILDDGGNLKAFSRMDGPQSLLLRWRRIKRIQVRSAYPRRTLSTLSGAIRRFWPASPLLRV